MLSYFFFSLSLSLARKTKSATELFFLFDGKEGLLTFSAFFAFAVFLSLRLRYEPSPWRRRRRRRQGLRAASWTSADAADAASRRRRGVRAGDSRRTGAPWTRVRSPRSCVLQDEAVHAGESLRGAIKRLNAKAAREKRRIPSKDHRSKH